MDDSLNFKWRRAELRYPDHTTAHQVALVDGRPPGEILTPSPGSDTTYDRFTLTINSRSVAVYDYRETIPRDR